MTDVLSLAKQIRNLGPEQRLVHETVAEMLECLGREIELLRQDQGAICKSVTVVCRGDWHGLYVDGLLIQQGARLVCDSLALRRLIAELGGSSEWVTLPAPDAPDQPLPDRLESLTTRQA